MVGAPAQLVTLISILFLNSFSFVGEGGGGEVALVAQTK